MRIKKWVGFFLNGRGEPDAMLVDHNPGHLAHTYQIEIDVPGEAVEHLTKRVRCVVLDKFGRPTGPCPTSPEHSFAAPDAPHA